MAVTALNPANFTEATEIKVIFRAYHLLNKEIVLLFDLTMKKLVQMGFASFLSLKIGSLICFQLVAVKVEKLTTFKRCLIDRTRMQQEAGEKSSLKARVSSPSQTPSKNKSSIGNPN
ncbi:hypothetical protein GBA52_018134 [Prunus armeniaca]|nr:hypothetical protein GBA52_018134 [Prunus armeniaca]